MLAGCGGGDTAGGEAADQTENLAEAAKLASGIPAYPGFAEGDVTSDETESESGKQEITYTSSGTPGEVYEFYKAYYAEAGYDLTNAMVTFDSDKPGYGGYVQVFNETAQVMVHVSPDKGSGEYSVTTQLGDGFPLYAGVPAEDYDVNERPSGSRLVIFRVKDDPAKILEFYRDAGVDSGMSVKQLYLRASNASESVMIYANHADTGSTVRTVALPKS